MPSSNHINAQTAIGVATIGIAAVMGIGAVDIKSDAGYGGIGSNFVPWFVCIGLAICGVLLVLQARSGGYRHFPEPSGAAKGDWRALAWVAAGLLLNAALIERVGFILSCTLCFVLAVRGLRLAEGKTISNFIGTIKDVGVGFCISAPVFWLFTKALKINLPGLTKTGWL